MQPTIEEQTALETQETLTESQTEPLPEERPSKQVSRPLSDPAITTYLTTGAVYSRCVADAPCDAITGVEECFALTR